MLYSAMGMNIDLSGEVTTEDMIKDLIEKDQDSQAKKEMISGTNYYSSVNDICKRDFREYYVDGQKYIDYNKSNEMIVNNLHKKLVDQKVGYIASKPVVVESEDEELAKKVNELLGDKFQDTIQEIIQGSSNKGIEDLQPFITEDNEFDFCIIPAEQDIYITDTTYEKNVEQVIRYYVMEFIEGNDVKERKRVEVWDKEKVTRYQETEDAFGNTEFTFIPSGTLGVQINPQYHWYTYNTNFTDKSQLSSFNDVTANGVEAHSWGRVPIISFLNNSEKRSDLIPIKRYIDALDIVSSGFVNDLKDVQLAIWVLRGYEGDSLADFMLNLQKFKAIKLSTDDNANAEPKTMDIPKEARVALMEWLEQKIYEVGSGVNLSKITGGSLTNVYIEAMFNDLDIKSNQMIVKIKAALSEFMYFVTMFINDRDNTDYNYKDVKFVFNKSMLSNKSGIVLDLKESLDARTMSRKTAIALNPYIDDAEEELKQIKLEEEDDISSLGGDMGFGDE